MANKKQQSLTDHESMAIACKSVLMKTQKVDVHQSVSKASKIHYRLFKFSSYKMGVSMNSWFWVTGRIYFKKKF